MEDKIYYVTTTDNTGIGFAPGLDEYKFTPKEDITAYELLLIFPIIFEGKHFQIASLPLNAARHFTNTAHLGPGTFPTP